MSLNNFFHINMPYGMYRNNSDEWFVFNREQLPLGWNKNSVDFSSNKNFESEINDESINSFKRFFEYPVFTKYEGLTDKLLEMSAYGIEGVIKVKNRIVLIMFYNMVTDPIQNPKYWDDYFSRIQILARNKVFNYLNHL